MGNIEKIGESASMQRQTNARESETITRGSEANARESETNARESETNTRGSESNTRGSETNARGSEGKPFNFLGFVCKNHSMNSLLLFICYCFHETYPIQYELNFC